MTVEEASIDLLRSWPGGFIGFRSLRYETSPGSQDKLYEVPEPSTTQCHTRNEAEVASVVNHNTKQGDVVNGTSTCTTKRRGLVAGYFVQEALIATR